MTFEGDNLITCLLVLTSATGIAFACIQYYLNYCTVKVQRLEEIDHHADKTGHAGGIGETHPLVDDIGNALPFAIPKEELSMLRHYHSIMKEQSFFGSLSIPYA
jgi:hypothetical protein